MEQNNQNLPQAEPDKTKNAVLEQTLSNNNHAKHTGNEDSWAENPGMIEVYYPAEYKPADMDKKG